MISIIIIVKNDNRVFKLLTELQSIDYPESNEIIVVDASKNINHEKYKKFPNAKVYTYPNKIKRTYAEQRNIGIYKSKGDIIVFIDADCIPSKEWLSKLTAYIRNGEEKIISGAVKPLKKDFIHIEEKYGKYRKECETMNIAIEKEVFTKVGYFDETLEGCEDSDFCIRAIDKNYKIRFVKEAYIYHDWGNILTNIQRSYRGGNDRANLYKKHFRHLFVFSSNNIYTLYYITYLILSPTYFFYPYLTFSIFLPSLIKLRNPIKEIYNISFTLGLIKQIMKFIL